MNDTARPREPAWDADAAQRQLVTDGYCRVRGVLDPAALRATVEAADAALATVGANHRAQWRGDQGARRPLPAPVRRAAEGREQRDGEGQR